MKIQHFRNATMVIEANDKVILVDPMLGPKSTMPPFSFIRFKAKKNPLVELPAACLPILDKVTHCLITHLHPDHLDKDGEQFLRDQNTPVICSVLDEKELRKRGLNVVQTIDYWNRVDFLGGKIEGIPAVHGYGFVAKPAGNVMGYYIELPDQPSIYLSSDTIYTEHVDKVFKEYNPALSVCASGSAQFDIFKPLLMHMEDIVKFTQNAPNKVLHNHMEAVNHCPTTRSDLKRELQSKGLLDKVFIPQDGEWINL